MWTDCETFSKKLYHVCTRKLAVIVRIIGEQMLEITTSPVEFP